MTRSRAVSACLIGFAAAAAAAIPVQDRLAARDASGLANLQGDALVRPEGYDRWPLVGASIGLSYSPGHADGPGTIHRVYINPASYDAFLATGRFPDRTVFVMEVYEPESSAPPLASGYYEGRRVGVEASVKSTRFADGWAFFDLQNGAAKTAPPVQTMSCITCHRSHAATDHVFTQFYPRLRQRASNE